MAVPPIPPSILLRITTLIPSGVLAMPPIPLRFHTYFHFHPWGYWRCRQIFQVLTYVLPLLYPRGYWRCRQYPWDLIRISIWIHGGIGGTANIPGACICVSILIPKGIGGAPTYFSFHTREGICGTVNTMGAHLRIFPFITGRVLVVLPIPYGPSYIFPFSYLRGYWQHRQYPRGPLSYYPSHTQEGIGGFIPATYEYNCGEKFMTSTYGCE